MRGQQSPNEVFLVPWHFESCISADTGTYLAGYHSATSPKTSANTSPDLPSLPGHNSGYPGLTGGLGGLQQQTGSPGHSQEQSLQNPVLQEEPRARMWTGSRGIILLYFGGMDLFRQSTQGAARKDATGKDRRVPGPRSRANPRPVTSCPVKCNYCNLPQPLKIQIPA